MAGPMKEPPDHWTHAAIFTGDNNIIEAVDFVETIVGHPYNFISDQERVFMAGCRSVKIQRKKYRGKQL